MTRTKEKRLMLKMTALAAALALAMVAVGPTLAQESATPKAAPEAEKTQSAYRLDFSVNEMEDGKKINTRLYSMHSRSGDGNEIKIGTRVPVEAKQSEFQYLDVGTSIWCRLRDQADVTAVGS